MATHPSRQSGTIPRSPGSPEPRPSSGVDWLSNLSGPPYKGVHGHSCPMCTPSVWWHNIFDGVCNEKREFLCPDHRKHENGGPAKPEPTHLEPPPTPEPEPEALSSNIQDFVSMPPSGTGWVDRSEKRYGHPEFYKILERMARLHSAKAHDYATDEDPLTNFRDVAQSMGISPWQVGWQFIATKFYRLVNLWKRAKGPDNESIDDSLMDMAIYCILTIILRGEDNGKKEPLFATATKEGPVYTWGPGGRELTEREIEALKDGTR